MNNAYYYDIRFHSIVASIPNVYQSTSRPPIPHSQSQSCTTHRYYCRSPPQIPYPAHPPRLRYRGGIRRLSPQRVTPVPPSPLSTISSISRPPPSHRTSPPKDRPTPTDPPGRCIHPEPPFSPIMSPLPHLVFDPRPVGRVDLSRPPAAPLNRMREHSSQTGTHHPPLKCPPLNNTGTEECITIITMLLFGRCGGGERKGVGTMVCLVSIGFYVVPSDRFVVLQSICSSSKRRTNYKSNIPYRTQANNVSLNTLKDCQPSTVRSWSSGIAILLDKHKSSLDMKLTADVV